MKTIIAAATFFLVACTSSMSTGSDSSMMFTASPSGSKVTLTLMNHGDAAIGYNLCTSALQRRDPNDWVEVRTDEVCTMELRTLQPGASATFEKTLPSDLRPGEYRYVTNTDADGKRSVAASNPFRVE